MTDFNDMLDRLEALERKQLGLQDLPVAALQRKLENDWQPDASVLLSTGSLGPEVFKGFTEKAPVAFGAGWANYGGAFEACTYTRIGRLVLLQGLALTAGGVAGNTTVLTLPAGFRPALQILGNVETNTGSMRYDITPAGLLQNAVAIGAGGWLGLTGIVFEAAA